MRAVVALVLLCGLAVPALASEEPEPASDGWPEWLSPLRVRGRLAEEFAYRLHDPGDESKLKTLGWLEAKYAFNESLSLRVATRAWYDAVFDVTDRYPSNVRRDQQTELSLREAVLAFSHGDFDVRIGRQQIVWGEAIGTFITDVVNPKDFREFILPDFSELRIPIWAIDFTYRLATNVTFEGVWTPDTLSNRLAKQGAEYQFTPPAYRFPGPVVRLPDDLDEFSLDRSEGGFRLSVLREGWDMSLIYYDTADKSPVNFQSRVANPPGPPITVLQPKHPRLHIVGATLAKSLEPVVLRAEAALTIGKRYASTNQLDADGVVRPRHARLAPRRGLHVLRRPRHGAADQPEDPDRLREQPHPARRRGSGHDAVHGPHGHRLPRQHAESDDPVRRERQPRRPAHQPPPGLAGDRRAHDVGGLRHLPGAPADAVRAVRQYGSRDLLHHLEVLT